MFEFISTYGELLAKTAIVVGGCISFLIYIKTELTLLRADVNKVIEHQKIFMDSLKQLNIILTQIAVQDTRLNMMEKDIDELRHHKGFID